MKKNKYFKVTAKCGYVGRKNYVPIAFAVKAINGKEAAKKTKSFPRVKRHHKDVILDVKEITHKEYLIIIEINNNDPYLSTQNIQEQRLIKDFDKRVVKEKEKLNKYDIIKRKERVNYKLKKFKEMNKVLKGEINAYIY